MYDSFLAFRLTVVEKYAEQSFKWDLMEQVSPGNNFYNTNSFESLREILLWEVNCVSILIKIVIEFFPLFRIIHTVVQGCISCSRDLLIHPW